MKDMIEYTREMSDISFSEKELTEADGLVFSQMAYFDYSLLPSQLPILFKDITDENLMKKMVSGTWNEDKNLALLKEIVTNARFKNIEILKPVNVFEKETEQQFSAVTFKLSDEKYCVSFRGTSSTFVGWKENFNMSYLDVLPSQKSALEYFENIYQQFSGDYYLVGHSKGGNLAEYVSTKVDKGVLKVYNFDGPGLQTKNKLSTPDERIKKIIPSSSMVGVLFETEQNFTIAQSNRIGILQHDLFSWEINDENKIVTEIELSWSSLYTQRVTLALLSSLDLKTKQTFLDSLYEITKSLDSPYLASGLKPELKNIETIFLGLKNTDKEIKTIWKLVLKSVVVTSIQEGLPKFH